MARPNTITFGQRIKAIRSVHGWSQKQMADAIGVEQATVSRLENDEWEPSRPVKMNIERLEASARAGQAA